MALGVCASLFFNMPDEQKGRISIRTNIKRKPNFSFHKRMNRDYEKYQRVDAKEKKKGEIKEDKIK